MKIIKFNQSKSAKGSTRTQGGNGGGIYTNTTPAPSVNLEPYALKTQILWEKGEGNNSVIEKNHNLQATNENETAVGKYNQSISGETIFTVGIGDGEDSRKNGLAVTSSGLSAETASIDNLTSITANMGDVTAKTENVGTLTSQTITNNGLIKTNQFETQTLKAVSGYIQTLMSEEITTEYLEVTKAAHFFKLVIDEIKAVGGRLIITPASAEIHHVEELSDRFRCYFKANDGKKQIYQEFEKDDQIICQTFNCSVGTSYNVSNTYYWRLCVGVSDSTITIGDEDFFYVDLSKTDKDKYSVSSPKKGDNIVQLGNRSKEERQAAIVISAYNDGYLDPEIKAPSLVQYQGINDYSLKNHRLNIISKGLNQFKGAHLNNADKNLDTKIDDLSTTVSNKVSEITQTINGISTRVSNTETSISTVSKKVDGNKAATDKAIANTNNTITALTQTVKNNYSTLDQKADSISSRVSSNSETITAQGTSISNLKSGLNSTNSTITALTKTVKDNYSTLDQKADGISTTVSTNTKSINELNGKVTNQATAISKIDQKADSISSTVTTINNNYASKSLLTQTSNSILAQVNNTYIKIGDDNITLGGNTTVKGSLTLTQTDQGFKLVGADGITEIMPKSIGTYNDFKSSNTNTQQVVKTINCNGAQSTSDDILRFQGFLLIYLGDRKKGDFIKCKFNSLTANVTNGWNGSSFTENFPISSTFSAKVSKSFGSLGTDEGWGTVYSNKEYTYTFDKDVADARIYVTFKGNTLYSRWKGNYDVYQGKPMPMPNALAEVNCTLTLPTTAHMLIGYDGWGANFGNNKTVYCGKDGLIASYGGEEFRITSNGIWNNNKRNVAVVDGTGYSNSSPKTYLIDLPIDTVLCKGDNCKVIFPKNPPQGYMLTIFDKCLDKCYFSSNYAKVQDSVDYGTDYHVVTNDELTGRLPWRWTYIDGVWYQEYIG